MEIKVVGSSSKGNGYALITDDEILLIECGVPFKQTMKTIDYQTSKVVGCVCSHFHNDHSGYIKQYKKYGIDIYSSKEVYVDILETYKEKTIYLERKKSRQLGGFKVTPLKVPHGEAECDMWLIQHKEIGCLLFITDAEYLPYNLSGMKVTHALVECNFSEDYLERDADNFVHVIAGHMELQVAKSVIQRFNQQYLRTVGLIHLSGVNGDPARFQKEISEVTSADVWVADKGVYKNI